MAEPHARDLGYFSRLADAETFTRAAWVELHRAGIATATSVCDVMDGADWEQTFLDVHRADAIRILDFPHAVEYLTKAAQASWGQSATAPESWVQEQAHILKHDEHGAAKVLVALAHLLTERSIDPVVARQARETALNYLTKRLDQIQYARFQGQGLPIGSGSVESANKLVVEARLKDSGMHWARSHVNAVVALRTIACSDRWTGGLAANRVAPPPTSSPETQATSTSAPRDTGGDQHTSADARRGTIHTSAKRPPPLTNHREWPANCPPPLEEARLLSRPPTCPHRAAKILTPTLLWLCSCCTQHLVGHFPSGVCQS
jgi:hypothetical protein